MLAALGIETSLNDVLSWCIAVMSAEREEQQLQGQAPDSSGATSSSPLKAAWQNSERILDKVRG